MTKNEKEKVQILAVSIDSHEDSQKFLQKLKERFAGDLDFPMLEDKNYKVIDRYGILNPDGKGWPHPTTYIIDKQGVLRWRFVEVNSFSSSILFTSLACRSRSRLFIIVSFAVH